MVDLVSAGWVTMVRYLLALVGKWTNAFYTKQTPASYQQGAFYDEWQFSLAKVCLTRGQFASEMRKYQIQKSFTFFCFV